MDESYENLPLNAEKSLALLAQKELKRRAARVNLRDFIEYCMPDPEHYEDATKSLYQCHPVHELVIDIFTRTINRETLRSALSIPSQHGKTTVCAEYGLAFYAAKNPSHYILYGTYSEPRAGIVGDNILRVMQSERFKEVFPEFELRKGTKSKTNIGFAGGGSIMFLGRNSGGSGNPCNLFVIDDPFKNISEAKSSAIRTEVWDWYTSVVEARCPAHTPIFIVHTRWSDDDLIARLCDKEHPDYDPEDNDNFDYLNLPGVIYEENEELCKLLNVELCSKEDAAKFKLPMRAGTLWPKKTIKDEEVDHWPLWLYMNMKRKNATTFSAMVMGNPVPPEGDFFTNKMIHPYRRSDLPSELRNYGASDHAVSTAKRADHTVMGCAGLDTKGEIWVYPDFVWQKIETPKQVEKMVGLIQKYRPLNWYAEGDHIKKAIGPFLKLRLKAKRLFCTSFRELPKHSDKQQKAQAIRGMMELGMVHLPIESQQYSDIVAQLLRFDGSEGRPDDFVDFLANLGRGLDKMIAASTPAANDDDEELKTGSMAWIKAAGRAEAKMRNKSKGISGW